MALRNRDRSRRFAARWLQRWLDETAGVTIDEAVMVALLLAALGGSAHEQAIATLREITGARRSSRRPPLRTGTPTASPGSRRSGSSGQRAAHHPNEGWRQQRDDLASCPAARRSGE